MAREGQIEFIEDLLEKTGLTREDLAEECPEWRHFEHLDPLEASCVIDWLREDHS